MENNHKTTVPKDNNCKIVNSKESYIKMKKRKRGKVDSQEVIKLGKYTLTSLSREEKSIFFPHRLELIRKLGEGAFSKVYLVLDYYTKKKMVLKSAPKPQDSTKRTQLYLEHKILKIMANEPGFPMTIGYYEDGEKVYLLQEYVQGLDLYDYVTLEIPSSENEILSIYRSFAEIVNSLHEKGVVHNDLKSENLIINILTGSITVIDFGLSEILGKDKIEKAYSKSGSLEYIAPDKLNSDRKTGKYYSGTKSDFYSLGVVLYILLFHYFPFQGNVARERTNWKEDKPLDFDHERKVSKACKEFLQRSLSIFPEKRFNFQQIMSHPWISSRR
jgi:serine/threonine protein kinase